MADGKQKQNILQPSVDRIKMRVVLKALRKRMFQLAVDAMLGKKKPMTRERSNRFNSFRTITTKWMCYINADYVKLYSLDLIFDPDKNKGVNGDEDTNRTYPFADPNTKLKNPPVDLLSSNNDFQISTYEDNEIPEKYAAKLSQSIKGRYNPQTSMFMVTPTTEYILTKYLYRIIEKYNLAKNQQNINYNLRAAANASKKNDIEDAVDKTIAAITSNTSGKQESKYGEYTNNADTNEYRVGGFKEMQDEIDIIIKNTEADIKTLLEAVKKYGESSKQTVRGTYKVEEILTPYQNMADGIVRALHERSNNMVRSIMDGQTNLYAILGLREDTKNREIRKTLRTQVGSESLDESAIESYEDISRELEECLYERLMKESENELFESNNNIYFEIKNFNHSYQDMNNYFLDNAAKALENVGIIESEADIKLKKWIQENSYIYTTDTGQDEFHTLVYMSYRIDKAGQSAWLGINTPNAIYQITINGAKFPNGCFIAPVYGGDIIGSAKYTQLLLKRISNHWNGQLENTLANKLKYSYKKEMTRVSQPNLPRIELGVIQNGAIIPTYKNVSAPAGSPPNIPQDAMEQKAKAADEITAYFRSIGGNIAKVANSNFNISEVGLDQNFVNDGNVRTIVFDIKQSGQIGDSTTPNYIYLNNLPPTTVKLNLAFVDKSSIDGNFTLRGISVTMPVEAIVVSNNRKN